VANGIGIWKCRSLREMGKPPENSWREDKNQNLTQRPNGTDTKKMHFKWDKNFIENKHNYKTVTCVQEQ